MRKYILSLVALLALFSCLDANPFTLPGELRAPDAYILPNKAAKVQFTSYIRKEKSVSGSDFEAVFLGMLQVGILNRIELGLLGGDDVFFGNVKLKVIEETTSIPQVAIGVDNLFSVVSADVKKDPPTGNLATNPDRYFYERNSLYVAFSKQTVVRGFLGIPELSAVVSGGFGRNRFVGQVVRSKQFEGLFASVEFSPYPGIVTIGEIDGSNINLGVKYTWNNFSAKLGYLGFEESLKSNNPNHRIALGLSYVFDKYADARRRPYLPDSEVSGVPGSVSQQQIGQGQSQSTGSSANDLLEELKRLRESREQAQKVLEELRRQLQEIEREASGQ